jgi:hypothetical protein
MLHGSVDKERAENIKKTWGDNVDLLFYGDIKDIDNDMFKVTDRTDYNSNEEKFCNMFNIINTYYGNYEWFFFCDNDTFVNTKLLFEKIDEFDENYIYGQVINTWPQDKTLHYLSGGAGFLISGKLIDTLNKDIEILGTNYSDVTFGKYIRENNLKMKHSELFKSQLPEYYNIENIKDYITFHYVKTYDKMLELQNICKN